MCNTCEHTAQDTLQVNARRYDPTRTQSLRDAFVRDVNRRFVKLKRLIKQAIVDQDCFGMRQTGITVNIDGLPGQGAFAFDRNAKKVEEFMGWLRGQVDKGVLQVGHLAQAGTGVEDAWTNLYVQDSYKRGLQRARYEMRNAGLAVPTMDSTGGVAASMSTPFHIDRVGLAYTRTFQELKGITAAMDTQISRVLAQGLADGDHPRLLARKLLATTGGPLGDLGIKDSLGRFIPAQRRAQTLARTEVVRAHHVAMMTEYENWAVDGLVVQAEWVTAGFNVCPECEALEGQVFTLQEVKGMIPKHPNCKCVAVPVPAEGMPAATEQVQEPGWEEKFWEATDDLNTAKAQMEAKYNIKLGGSVAKPGHKSLMNKVNKAGEVLGDQLFSKVPLFRQETNHLFLGATGENRIYWSSKRLFTGLDKSLAPSGAPHPRVLGMYDPGSIRVGWRSMARMKDQLKIGGANNHNVGVDFGSVLRHEYGHHLETLVNMRRIRELYGDLGQTYIRKNVSYYASTDASEFFAEIFQAYTSPLYGQKYRLPEQIERVLESIIGKRVDL